MTQSVELHAAWQWDCDNCGVENFTRAAKYEGPPICVECRHTEDEHASEGQYRGYRFCEAPDCNCQYFEPIEGEWITTPTNVTCKACGSTYKATNPLEEQDEA